MGQFDPVIGRNLRANLRVDFDATDLAELGAEDRTCRAGRIRTGDLLTPSQTR
jgi:hypothetical protein